MASILARGFLVPVAKASIIGAHFDMSWLRTSNTPSFLSENLVMINILLLWFGSYIGLTQEDLGFATSSGLNHPDQLHRLAKTMKCCLK